METFLGNDGKVVIEGKPLGWPMDWTVREAGSRDLFSGRVNIPGGNLPWCTLIVDCGVVKECHRSHAFA
jgi:hypothetical protein